jgi:hypothetical protein
VVTEDDLRGLPAAVQRYFRFVGAVGRPRPSSVRIECAGEFRAGLKKPWCAFRSEQVNTFDPPVRAFYMTLRMYGVPMQGLHLLKDGHATMQIAMAGMFEVVNAAGPEMDHGETVTFFNDLCGFAPGALAGNEAVEWDEVGPRSVMARFRQAGQKISALLAFDDVGRLVNFTSEDRYYCEDGKTYLSYPWATPVREWGEFNGVPAPRATDVLWRIPGRDPFVYGRFRTVNVS